MKRVFIILAMVAVAVTAWCQDDTTTLSQTQMAVQAETISQESVVAQPQQPAAQEPVTVFMVSTIDIVLALLALVSLGIAWSTRRSLTRLRNNYIEDIEAVNVNMQKLAQETAQHIEAIERKHAQAVRASSASSQPRQQRVSASNSDAHRVARQDVVKTLYLSKPDENATFTRASEEFELGNSIYVLTTRDGVRGEFGVIDNRDVHSFALMMPGENLIRACSGSAIQMSAGMTRIITDRPGEAVCENGKWHVKVKAAIHYE